MSRPVIGIAAYLEQARWNIWDTRAAIIHESYLRGVSANGGRPVVVPPDTVDADILDRLDGLLLPGGVDIDPALSGQARHPETDRPQPQRDAAEQLLLRGALERDLPVLGICRGLQLLTLEYGGILYQHLPDVLGHTGHCPAEGVFGEHRMEFAAGSLLAEVYGPRTRVNSHHHQGIDDPGSLRVTGRSDDGLAEAAEDPSRRFVVGVQWHPEVSGDDILFARFVAACADRAVSARLTPRPGPVSRARVGGQPALDTV